MSGVSVQNIKKVLTPKFITTLEHHYDTLAEYAKHIQTPITLTKAYEDFIYKIEHMNISDEAADMLDNIVFNTLKHNAVRVIGTDKQIIIGSIVFDVFNDVFIYSLTTMFNHRIKLQLEVIDIEQDLEGLQLYNNIQIRLTAINLISSRKEKTYPLNMPLYFYYRTRDNYADKNKLIGTITYNEDDGCYDFVFDETANGPQSLEEIIECVNEVDMF